MRPAPGRAWSSGTRTVPHTMSRPRSTPLASFTGHAPASKRGCCAPASAAPVDSAAAVPISTAAIRRRMASEVLAGAITQPVSTLVEWRRYASP